MTPIENLRVLLASVLLGVATATGCAVAALLYLFELRKLYRVFLFGTAAVLVVSSHFGGSLTHGRGYLVQYAPQSLRALLGLKEKGAPATAPVLGAASHLAPANQPVFAKLIGCFVLQAIGVLGLLGADGAIISIRITVAATRHHCLAASLPLCLDHRSIV